MILFKNDKSKRFKMIARIQSTLPIEEESESIKLVTVVFVF